MNYWKEVAQHFRRIRTDPVYRMHERMQEIERDLEPSYFNDPEKLIQETPIKETPLTPKEWGGIQQLKARLIHCENKLVEHLAKSKEQMIDVL